MEKIVALCKRRGFIYSGSEIYNGLAGTWDYGPLGTLLKNNTSCAPIQNILLEITNGSTTTTPTTPTTT